MHCFETVANNLERFSKSFLKRGFEFLVNGMPHLLQFFFIALLQFLDLFLQGISQLIEPILIRFNQCADPLFYLIDTFMLNLLHLSNGLDHGSAGIFIAFGYLLSEGAGMAC
jgi:hypothetical protein